MYTLPKYRRWGKAMPPPHLFICVCCRKTISRYGDIPVEGTNTAVVVWMGQVMQFEVEPGATPSQNTSRVRSNPGRFFRVALVPH